MRTERPSMRALEIRRLLSVELQPFADDVPDYVLPGEPLVTTILLTNQGDTATSGPVGYRVVLSTDADGKEDVISVATGTVPAIAAGGERTVAVNFTPPSSIVGRHRRLVVTIDPDNAIAEGREGDNVARADVSFASLLGSDTIVGTDGDDTMQLYDLGDDRYYLVRNALSFLDPDFFLEIGTFPGISHLTVDLKAGNDRFDADETAVSVLGGDGKDTIQGGSGKDTLDAGAGDDFVRGGDGDDTAVGGAGDDTVLGDAGSDHLEGSDGDDSITGSTGADTILGGAGNDAIGGDGDADSIDAGDGDDYVRGDLRKSIFTGVAGNDTIAGGAGRDTLLGDEGDDRISGGSGGDSLNGGAGADTLLGQGGRDRLRGGAGSDRLLGGAGDDRFDALDGAIDILSGNSGDDDAFADASDLLAGIERRET